LQLAKDRSLREKLGNRGQQLVLKEFDVDRMVDELFELYQRLVDKHSIESQDES